MEICVRNRVLIGLATGLSATIIVGCASSQPGAQTFGLRATRMCFLHTTVPGYRLAVGPVVMRKDVGSNPSVATSFIPKNLLTADPNTVTVVFFKSARAASDYGSDLRRKLPRLRLDIRRNALITWALHPLPKLRTALRHCLR